MEVPPAFFEGCEKSLEVSFFGSEVGLGLHALNDEVLTKMMDAAKCRIVETADKLSNDFLDAYLLSKSSLFIFPTKLIVKTCGVTTPLSLLKTLLDEAKDLKLFPKGVVYTRGHFIFPHLQDKQHVDFAEETNVLNHYFGKLGNQCAQVLGHQTRKQWHVYSSGESNHELTLEVSMTGLDDEKATVFNIKNTNTFEEMTDLSGICGILPESKLTVFAFDLAGYSMNAVDTSKVSTIHVTPQSEFSFASYECYGYDFNTLKLQELLARVVTCFKPKWFIVAIHGSTDMMCMRENSSVKIEHYRKENCNTSTLGKEGSVVFYTFSEEPTGKLLVDNVERVEA